jgi:hypothetical protein
LPSKRFSSATRIKFLAEKRKLLGEKLIFLAEKIQIHGVKNRLLRREKLTIRRGAGVAHDAILRYADALPVSAGLFSCATLE